MNGLYPIVRRVRRPLLPVEAAADAKPVAEPAPAVPVVAPTETQPKGKDKRGKVAASQSAKQARA